MSERQQRAAFAAAVVVLAIALAGVFLFEVPFLSNDGPSHALAAFIHAHIDDPAYAFARYYDAASPWTDRGFDQVFLLLEPIVGWMWAYQTTVIVTAELWAFGFLAFVYALEPRRAWVGLLGFPLALQTSLYLGFYPFILATAFGFFALAAWIRRPPGIADHVLVAALLFACARCHVIALSLTGLALGVVTLARHPPARWPRALAGLLVASVPALAILALSSEAVDDVAGPAESAMWGALLSRVVLVCTAFQPGGMWRPLCALVLGVLGVASAVRAARAGAMRAEEKGLLVVGVVFVLASMSLPRDIANWQLVNVRLLPLGLGALVALIGVERATRTIRAISAVAVAGYCVSSLIWGAFFHREIAEATRGALAALPLVTLKPRELLPIVVKPWGDHSMDFGIDGFAPLIHVSELYVMNMGGATAYSQTTRASMHLAVRKTDPATREIPPKEDWLDVARVKPGLRSDVIRKLLVSAATHEGVFFYGEPGDVRTLEDAGFTVDTVAGGVALATFHGCAGTLEMAGLVRPTDVEVGWWPRRTAAYTVAATPGPDGRFSAPLTLGCGAVWLYVDGQMCTAATKPGPLVATFAPGDGNASGNRLTCDLAQR